MHASILESISDRVADGESLEALTGEIEAAVMGRREARGEHAAWGLLCERAGLMSLAFTEFQLALRDDREDETATLLLVDLFPSGPRDPQGIHKPIWDEFIDNEFALPQDKRLTLAAYAAGTYPEAFIEPVTVGIRLPEMPVFLSPDVYVPVPLEETYQSAWETVPAYWREVLEGRDHVAGRS